MNWPRPSTIIALTVLVWAGLALLKYLTGWDVEWWHRVVTALALGYIFFAPWDPVGPWTKKIIDKIGERIDRKPNGSS